MRGILGGSVMESLPANARDTGSVPGPGGSHGLQSSWTGGPQLLSLCSGAWEPQPLRLARLRALASQQEKPSQWEALTSQLEGGPHSPQLEKSPQWENPAQSKKKKIIIRNKRINSPKESRLDCSYSGVTTGGISCWLSQCCSSFSSCRRKRQSWES